MKGELNMDFHPMSKTFGFRLIQVGLLVSTHTESKVSILLDLMIAGQFWLATETWSWQLSLGRVPQSTSLISLTQISQSLFQQVHRTKIAHLRVTSVVKTRIARKGGNFAFFELVLIEETQGSH